MSPSSSCHRIVLLAGAAAVICLVLAAMPAAAQAGLRTLTGTVTDGHHEPLSGAIVQLEDDNTGSVISYITSRSGRYSFKRLSTDDDYHVSAAFRDAHSRSRFLSKFDARPTRNIALVIKSR